MAHVYRFKETDIGSFSSKVPDDLEELDNQK